MNNTHKKGEKPILNNYLSDMDRAQFVYDLRTSEDGYRVSMTEQPINWNEHLEWWKNHRGEFTILGDGKGYLRQDVDDWVSIMILPEYRNEGFGSQVLKEITGKALIRIDNPQSVKAFLKAGWELRGYYLEKK